MAHCIHGMHWDGVSDFRCPQCCPNASRFFVFEMARSPDDKDHEAARLRAEILSHVEQWTALGKLLDHTWDTGPKPNALVEDVRQLVDAVATVREQGRREAFQQALGWAEQHRDDGRMVGDWRMGAEAVMKRITDALAAMPAETDRLRATAASAREQGRLEERAAICADIRGSAIALDKISDTHPIRNAIRPVFRSALLSVADYYEAGKHMTASASPEATR